MDAAIPVTDAEAEHWRRRLALRKGLHVSFSAANTRAAAAPLASGADAAVATLLCDTGLRY